MVTRRHDDRVHPRRARTPPCEVDPQTGDVITTVSDRRQELWFMGPDGSDQRQMEVQPADSDWSVVGGDWAPTAIDSRSRCGSATTTTSWSSIP